MPNFPWLLCDCPCRWSAVGLSVLGKPFGRARESRGRGPEMTAVLERDTTDVAAEGGDVGQPIRNMLKAKDLHTALSDAVNFAAPASAMLPILEAVRLEFGEGQLIAVATDRFTLGASRVDYSGEAFTVLIAAKDAKALVKMAKTLKRDERGREVDVEVAESDVTFRFNSGEALTVRGLDAQFVPWRHLLPSDEDKMGGLVGEGYTASLLAKFAKVRADERHRMAVFPTSTDGRVGPTIIRIGPDFIGLLMPQRAAGGRWSYDRPNWLDTTASSATAAAPMEVGGLLR